MGRPPKVGGLRTTRTQAESEEFVLPERKDGLYQFISAHAAMRFSVRRRRVLRGPDGEAIEESPRTTDGTDTPMDWVIFEDNHFSTESKELAEALIAKAKSMGQYGVGLQVWLLDDQVAAHKAAKEVELRRLMAEDPEVTARVLKPSEASDFVLPPTVA